MSTPLADGTRTPEAPMISDHDLRNLFRDASHTSIDHAIRTIYDRGRNDGILAASTQVAPNPPDIVVSAVRMREGDLTPIQQATILAFSKDRRRT